MRLNQITKIFPLALVAVMFYGCPSEELTSARLYVKEENWEKAEEMIAVAIELTPEEPEPYYLKGKEIHARKNEWSKMNEMFDKALELGSEYKLPDGQPLQAGIETWRTFYWSRGFNTGADAYNLALGATDATEKEAILLEAVDGYYSQGHQAR